MLIELNDVNGASAITNKFYTACLTEFNEPLIGAEFGVAFGGGIAKIGKVWKGRGIVYGFDTFEGHPEQISEECELSKQDGGIQSHAARCMKPWYDKYGLDKAKEDYIAKELKDQGIDNVTLVKGLVTEKTDVSFIPYLHYCLIDLDFPKSMIDAWNLVKNKIVEGGYLCLHDVVPRGHIHGLYESYQSMISEDLFDVVLEDNQALISVLRKK